MTNDDMTDRLRIGLVVPRADSQVPAEAALMYPEIEFVAAGVGVSALTPEGYESAWHGIVPAAAKLAEQGVHAVMVMGASLTFYRGYQSHEELMQNVQRVTGLPVSSMSAAAVDATPVCESRWSSMMAPSYAPSRMFAATVSDELSSCWPSRALTPAITGRYPASATMLSVSASRSGSAGVKTGSPLCPMAS